MKITSEMLEKAKTVEPVEELIRLATEKEVEASEEQIRKFYEMNHKSGELSDDELNNVAGGWCYNDGRPVITVGEQRDCFVCKECGLPFKGSDYYDEGKNFGPSAFGRAHTCTYGLVEGYSRTYICNCGNCKYCIYEKGLWLCDNPENRK